MFRVFHSGRLVIWGKRMAFRVVRNWDDGFSNNYRVSRLSRVGKRLTKGSCATARCSWAHRRQLAISGEHSFVAHLVNSGIWSLESEHETPNPTIERDARKSGARPSL